MRILLKSYTFWFAIIGILLSFYGGIMHEKVHQAIFDSYGIESKIAVFRDFPDMTTTGERPCPSDSNCELSHSINEAISYNLDMFYWLFYFGFLIIIFILENRGEKTENESSKY